MTHEPRGRGKSRQTLPLEVFDHMPQEAGDWARLLDLTAPHVGFLEPVLRGAATALRNQRRLVSRMERDLLILERLLEQEMERDGSKDAAADAGA